MKRQRMFNCLFKQVGETYKLFVYDNVRRDGWEESETSAKYFAEKLSEIPEGSTLEVHINSDGGDAFEGTAIYNQLKSAPIKKIGIVDGHAFSAATFILQACDERVMETGTTLLIHNAWTFAIGNANELRAVADDLDKLMESNRSIYLERCSMSEEELISLMAEDRMLSPKEALEFGFVDRIAESGADPNGEGEPAAAAAGTEPQTAAAGPEPQAAAGTPGTEGNGADPKPPEGNLAQPIREDRFNAAENYFRKFY